MNMTVSNKSAEHRDVSSFTPIRKSDNSVDFIRDIYIIVILSCSEKYLQNVGNIYEIVVYVCILIRILFCGFGS